MMFFFPNSGSIFSSAVTPTVTKQQAITIRKKWKYPTASCNSPATAPGSIMDRAMKAVQKA